MLDRLRNIWRPEVFHYHHLLERGGGPFEGWYVKLVDHDGRQPYALIPGVFLGRDRHAFIQVLDGRAGTATYHRFPIDAFSAARECFDIEIAGSRFSTSGIRLDIEPGGSSADQRVQGEVKFGPWQPWPVTVLSPGIMGPYSFVPFMQCNHGILSLDHALDGTLSVDDVTTDYRGGRGYVEKDWGRSFPAGYVWVHSNHFARAGISLTAAVAMIPWLTGTFRGYIIAFLLDGELHRFTTYTGSVLERLEMSETHLHLAIRNRTHRLVVDAEKSDGAILHAPYEEQMIERVAETMTSNVGVQLRRLVDDEVVFEGPGVNACLEAQGDLDAVLDR